MMKRLMMLAGIGGFLYAHKKRGGQMTLESFKDTGRSLIDSAKSKATSLILLLKKRTESTLCFRRARVNLDVQ